MNIETSIMYFEYIRLSGVYNMLTEHKKVIWNAISLFVYTSDLPDTEFPQVDGFFYLIMLNAIGKEPYTSQALSLPGGSLYLKAKDKYEDTPEFIREIGPMIYKLEEAKDYFIGLAKENRRDGDKSCMTTNNDNLLQQGIRIHSNKILNTD